jgi:SOS-response transcriptional repressor LexA
MGKWTKFKDKLQHYVNEEDYQSKVDEVKSALFQKSPNDLAEYLKHLKANKKELTAKLYEENLRIEAAQQLLLEWMTANGMDSIRLASGGLFSERLEPYTSVTDREALGDWVKKHKMSHLLQLPWALLNSLVKERLQSGEGLPPGVEVYIKTSLSMYGGKDEETAVS